MAAMDHLLPPPFYKNLSKLQDKAKSVEYHKIAALFQEEMGRPITDCFASFEREPVASASIAQVHRAQLKDGRMVAVKIQKPHIKKQFKGDMLMHHLVVFILEKSFDMPLLHFVEEIQSNLKKELDFRIEAANSKES
jgi:aarF domain-containing kinase